MKTYTYRYIYHNYNTFEKDGKAITYGQAVLAKRDGTPSIEKITNKDKDLWNEVASKKLDNIIVKVAYNKYGKVELQGYAETLPDSSAAYDDEDLPF